MADCPDYAKHEDLKLFDVSEIVKRALLHDLEESVTGDILYPLHNKSPRFKEKLDDVRNMCVDQELFEELPEKLRKYYIRLWKTSKDNTKEGKMIAFADKFEILMFSIQELDIGNKCFYEVYNNAVDIINLRFFFASAHPVIQEIRSTYG